VIPHRQKRPNPKPKKGNAVEETNSVDKVSNLTLDNFWITLVEFKKLTEYNQQRIINSIIAEKKQLIPTGS
jgi:hypothetical protein